MNLQIGDQVLYVQSTGCRGVNANRTTSAVLLSKDSRRWKIRLESGAVRYVNPTSLHKPQ